MSLSKISYPTTAMDEKSDEAPQVIQLWDTVFDAMNEAVMVYDITGKPILANPAASRIFNVDPLGQPIAGLLQKTSLRHFDTTPVQPHELPSRRALAGAVVKAARYCYTGGDGKEITIHVSAAPLREEGRIVGAIAVSTDVSEASILFKELTSERTLLDTLIDCAPVGIVVSDAEARIVRANRAAEILYARPVPLGEEYESHAALSLLHEDGSLYSPRDMPLTRAALDGLESRNVEMAIQWPDGQQRDLLVHTAPVRDPTGTVTGAFSILQDITERKQEQRDLRRYAERLATLRDIDRLILAASSAPALAVGVIPRIKRLLGCDHVSLVQSLEGEEFEVLAFSTEAPALAKAIQGETLEKLRQGQWVVIEEPHQVANFQEIGRSLLTEGVHTLVIAPLQANGHLIGALIAGTPRAGDPNALHGSNEVMEILHDVADQLAIGLHQIRLREQISLHAVRLERTIAQRTTDLQASEASFRAVFEQAATGIFSATLEGKITRHNAALSRMLGYPPGDLNGMCLSELDHPDDRNDAQARFARLARGETPDYQVEQRYLRKNGSEMVARLTVSLVRDVDQKLVFAFGLVEDITDQKRAYEALVQAEKLSVTGQMIAAVTHEINNPLQTVVGCLGLLEETLDENALDRANPYLNMAMQELRRVGTIMGELRDLHRKSSVEDMEPTNLPALIDHVVGLALYRAEEHSVIIDWTPPEGAPVVLPLVASRIHQVFLNLIFNAVDAMPDGGQIRIKMAATTHPPGATVSFEDTGTGIPTELMPHLFEPFRSTKTAGMGMGLYVCRNILHEHEGSIDIESTPSRGTKVTVWLPRPVRG